MLEGDFRYPLFLLNAREQGLNKAMTSDCVYSPAAPGLISASICAAGTGRLK